jgi:Zn/Cd-binding protein ZinT
MTTLNFNAAAAAALSARPGAKLRVEVRNGTMFIRPTDRKAGPHVLTEIQTKGKGIAVVFDEKQGEKLAMSAFANNSNFNVVPDKYGWFALHAGSEHEEAAAGAKVTIQKNA